MDKFCCCDNVLNHDLELLNRPQQRTEHHCHTRYPKVCKTGLVSLYLVFCISHVITGQDIGNSADYEIRNSDQCI